MKKIIILFSFFTVFALAVSGQEYRTGIGARVLFSNGLTIKYFISSGTAVEGLLTARYHGYNFTGLYEIYTEPFSVSNLYFYYGFGGHIGSWHSPAGKNWWDDGANHSVIGIDGIAGIEYNFGNVPFSISLDYKPGINIIGYPKLWVDELALSVRYVWGNR